MLPSVLRECVENLSLSTARLYATLLTEVFTRFDISTAIRQAAFLAQVGHESASFMYTAELASGKAYDTRADLGNADMRAIELAVKNQTTPGRFFKGHGLLQITGYSNHLACSRALYGDDRLVENPLLLTLPRDAALSAGWFWVLKGLNQIADLGNRKSFVRITKRINGGVNGLSDRLIRWERAKLALGAV